MPNRAPEDYLAEADLCRKRAADCTDELMAAEWHKLALEYEKHALIAEFQATNPQPDV